MPNKLSGVIMTRSNKILCIIGSILLLVMAVFSGSGLSWISGEISKSNSEGFLKDVFPVLFIQVSIHLFGLAILGIMTIFLAQGARKVLVLIVTMIFAVTRLTKGYPVLNNKSFVGKI